MKATLLSNRNGHSRHPAPRGRRTVVELLADGIRITVLKRNGKLVKVISQKTLRGRGLAPLHADALIEACRSGLLKPKTRIDLALPRKHCVIKWLSLPDVPPRELCSLLRFQAEKLIPFALSSVSLAFQVSAGSNGELSCQIAAVENSLLHELRDLVEEQGLHIGQIGVSSLSALSAISEWGSGLESERLLCLGRDGTRLEIDVLEDGRHVFGRAAMVPAGDARSLRGEIRRSEAAFRSQGGSACSRIVLYGSPEEIAPLHASLQGEKDRGSQLFSSSAVHMGASCAAIEALPVALGFVSSRKLADFSTGLAESRASRPWITMVGVAVLLLVAASFLLHRELVAREREVSALRTRYERISEKARLYRNAAKDLRFIRDWNESRGDPTDVLHRLVSHLPEDVYLRSLSIQADGELRVDGTALDELTISQVPQALAAGGFKEVRGGSYNRNERRGETVFDFNLTMEVR